MTTTDAWYCLDLITPEPWKVGPLSVIRKGGRMVPIIGRDASLHAYQNAIREAIESIGLLFFEGQLHVEMFFWRERAEYSTPQARTHRKHEADATNLFKAAEDALQNLLFKNDKDNIDIHARVIEQGPEVHSRLVIHVTNDIPRFAFPQEIWDAVDNETDGKYVAERDEPMF